MLATGLRVKKLEEASKIIVSCFILHNLCVQFGDRGDDLDGDGDDDDDPQNGPDQVPRGEHFEQREGRRNQLLRFFQT